MRLKGLFRVRKRLASGRIAVYWYAWRGGPRLTGAPGSAEFVAAYNEAVAVRRGVGKAASTLRGIIAAYERSADFSGLAERTRADYQRQLRRIEQRFGDFPTKALGARGARSDFLGWRDELAHASRRQADYAWTVLALVLAWAVDHELAPANPCAKAGRLYRADRTEKVWTEADEAAFVASAPAHLALALTLALWTGQRQGDLLRLLWSAYDEQWIRLRQGKTRRRVAVPVGAPLRAALDAAAKDRRGPLILMTSEGAAWTEDGFRSSWRKACTRAGIVGLTFHDLRGSAVSRLALAGATEAEIAALTGHSLRDVGAILDAHYLNRDPALAASAVAKLERRRNDGTQTKL